MKIVKTIVCVLVFALLLSSCTSTKNQETVPVDNYDSLTASSDSEQIVIEKSESQNKNQNLNKKKEKNAFEKFFTFGNKDDFVYVDEFSVFTTGALGGIKQKKADFMIAPEKQTAGFGSTYMAAYYIVQMNEESRKSFINAVNQYFSDFENKRLERKGRNTFKKYGNINVHLDWGTIASSTPNNADGKAMIGYEFIKNSPYFSITMYPMHNNHWDVVGDATSKESMSLKYYFTKAQALQFINSLEEKSITKLLLGYSSDEYLTPEEIDEY